MISGATLATAVERGLISAEQADALRAIDAQTLTPGMPGDAERDADERIDDERLRFISGFGDLFVTIGLALFIGACGYLAGHAAGSLTPAFCAAAAAAWLLAEFFTRRRRLALSSIVLLTVFVAGSFEALLATFGLFLHGPANALSDDIALLPTTNGPALCLAGLGALGFAALHYARFRVPVTVAAGMAVFCLAVLGVAVTLDPDLNRAIFNALVLVCGFMAFVLAMAFDLSDPARLTRRSDIAFWLHLLAAPLIVHTLIRFVLSDITHLTKAGAVAILAVYLALGVIAIVIDRRALLTSGLVYGGVAFGTLLTQLGLAGEGQLLPTVALALGVFVLLLSAGWHPLRRAILRLVPAALAARLPHASSATP